MTETSFPVDVLIKDGVWVEHIPDPEAFCIQIVNAVTTLKDNYKHGEISIALVSDKDIQTLNKTYRNKDKPTNVLSFPDDGPAPLLGDIVVARETVVREAESAEKSIRNHLAHMLVHGFLHLQGYDHETDEDAAVMEGLEIEALAILNIDNPYKIKELQDK